MGKHLDGRLLILGMERFRKGPFEVKKRILDTRKKDGKATVQYIEQDPGAAGKSEAQSLRRAIAKDGYTCKTRVVTKDKLTRFLPFSATAETEGEVVVVRGSFKQNEEEGIEAFYKELEFFSGDGSTHDDIVDCCSGGHDELYSSLDLGNFALGSLGKENFLKNI
jgi:predicted phage terminase large subunit-like protein